MKAGNRSLFEPLDGLSEIEPPEGMSAQTLENVRVEPQTSGWDSRIGWETIYPAVINNNSTWGPFDQVGPVHSCFYWTTRNAAKNHLLFEADFPQLNVRTRILNYQGNPAESIVFDDNRRILAPNQYGTHYETYGRYLIILNGRDKPIIYDGIKQRTMGFQQQPSPPNPWEVESAPSTTTVDKTNTYLVPLPDSALSVEASQVIDFEVVYGLGTTTENKLNTFRYKVTWLYENGSESPISQRSNPTTWKTTAQGFKYAVWLDNIPRGPEGVVARRLYRTKNLGDSPTAVGTDINTEEEVYFFLDQIDNNVDETYFDTTPDSRLGSLAPRDDHSVVFPARTARFAATFKNCLFLDGGEGEGGVVYYSVPGAPDQYRALDFFNVGTGNAGDVTGLQAYYDNLIVFRERGIDIITGDPINGFVYTPFIRGYGTKSPQSSVEVPTLGIMFLSDDGIYLLSGGLKGGEKLRVQKLTAHLQETFDRMNTAMLHKAVTAYSPKWKEVHFYFPNDGEAENSIGVIFHLDKKTFSKRVGFPVSCITTDEHGEFIFGTPFGRTTVNARNGVQGLYYISRKRNNGTKYVGSGDSGRVQLEEVPLTTTYKSAEQQWGFDGVEKNPRYLYLKLLTRGNNKFIVTCFKNQNIKQPVDIGGGYTQPSDDEAQKVFNDPAVLIDAVPDDFANFGEAVWEKPSVQYLRYDVAMGSCNSFSFQVQGTADFTLCGYAIDFGADGKLVRAVRGQF